MISGLQDVSNGLCIAVMLGIEPLPQQQFVPRRSVNSLAVGGDAVAFLLPSIQLSTEAQTLPGSPYKTLESEIHPNSALGRKLGARK